jgi:hypothetical protein
MVGGSGVGVAGIGVSGIVVGEALFVGEGGGEPVGSGTGAQPDNTSKRIQ